MPNPEDLDIFIKAGDIITFDSLKALELAGDYFQIFVTTIPIHL